MRPRYIQLETTALCNGGCPHCPQEHAKRSRTIMPDELIRQCADEARGWGVTWRPFMIGEPLLDERMPTIVRRLKADPTARVELHSNASRLTTRVGRDLLLAGLDVMRLSIDGFWPETMQRARPGIDPDEVTANAERFCRMARTSNCQVEVRAIGDYLDADERDLYRARWERFGAKVEFTALYRYPWTGQAADEVPRASCRKVLREMFVCADGDAVLCCWDVGKRAVLGNVEEDGLLAVWQGAARRAYCEALAEGCRDLIGLCSRCDAYREG